MSAAHSWRSVAAPAGESARATCKHCNAHRRIARLGAPVEFSRDGIVWGERFACEPTKEAQS